MNRFALLIVLSSVSILSAPAVAQLDPRTAWKGANKEWDTAAEWTDGVPTANHTANISHGTAEIKVGKTGVAKDLYLNRTANNEGTCKVNGGTLDVVASIMLGGTGAVGGRLQLLDGAVKCSVLSVGRMGRGTVEQSGGAVGSAVAPLRTLLLGENNASLGIYTISGGTIHTEKLYVGWHGPGEFTQSGGTVNALVKDMEVGSLFPGLYTVSDGSLAVSKDILIGMRTLGTFTQSGGTVTANGMSMGEKPTSVGEYEMSGGTATTQANVSVANKGNATLKVSGGTFRCKGDLSVGEASGTGSVQVQGGKLLVDGSAWLNGTAAGPSNAGSGELRIVGDGSVAGIVRATIKGTVKSHTNNGVVHLFRNGIIECGKDEVGAAKRVGNGSIKKLPAFDGGGDIFFSAGPGSEIIPEDEDSSYGRIEVDGDAELDGTLVDVELGGEDAGATHDQFRVTGALWISGGTLSVSFGPGFHEDQLSPGMEFVVVQGNPIVGGFSLIELPAIANDMALVAEPRADAIIVRVVSTGD